MNPRVSTLCRLWPVRPPVIQSPKSPPNWPSDFTTLDEIANDITRDTPASFEPTLDYVVTKIPRFNFDKFRGADTTLTTQMKSVGEVMAIGRTFQESVQKALRGLEVGLPGFFEIPSAAAKADFWEWRQRLAVPAICASRIYYGALRAGISAEEIVELSSIDPWFIENLEELFLMSEDIREKVKSIEALNKAIA